MKWNHNKTYANGSNVQKSSIERYINFAGQNSITKQYSQPKVIKATINETSRYPSESFSINNNLYNNVSIPLLSITVLALLFKLRKSSKRPRACGCEKRNDKCESNTEPTSHSDLNVTQSSNSADKLNGEMNHVHKPEWMRVPGREKDSPIDLVFQRSSEILKKHNIVTVCEEAKCPNIVDCWGGYDNVHEAITLDKDNVSDLKGTATIMVLGSDCTRGCRFCAVDTKSNPAPPDPTEPLRVAKAIKELNEHFQYVVLTTTDRDDLEDGGAQHVADCINNITWYSPEIIIEALVGDYQGNKEDIEKVVSSDLAVFAHNIETVERLTSTVRDYRATYRQSLMVLQYAKEVSKKLGRKVLTKSGIMLGLGETLDEVKATMRDLRTADVDIVYVGQYLRPSEVQIPMERYLHPAEFEELKKYGYEIGFKLCVAGPLVRSSYKAGEYYFNELR